MNSAVTISRLEEAAGHLRHTIRTATVTALNSPTVSRRLTDLGYLIVGDQPEQFAAFLKSEIDKLARIIKALNLKPE